MYFLLFYYFAPLFIFLFGIIIILNITFKEKKSLNYYILISLIFGTIIYDVGFGHLFREVKFIKKVENLDPENINSVEIWNIKNEQEKIIIDDNELEYFCSDLKMGKFCLEQSPFDLKKFKLVVDLKNEEAMEINAEYSSNNGLILNFFLPDGAWIGSAKNEKMKYYMQELIVE